MTQGRPEHWMNRWGEWLRYGATLIIGLIAYQAVQRTLDEKEMALKSAELHQLKKVSGDYTIAVSSQRIEPNRGHFVTTTGTFTSSTRRRLRVVGWCMRVQAGKIAPQSQEHLHPIGTPRAPGNAASYERVVAISARIEDTYDPTSSIYQGVVAEFRKKRCLTDNFTPDLGETGKIGGEEKFRTRHQFFVARDEELLAFHGVFVVQAEDGKTAPKPFHHEDVHYVGGQILD